MKKILFSLFILLAVNSQAQFVYPTETVWDFLSGLQTNRINSSSSSRLGINVAPLQDFHVLADTVRFEGLDGTGGFLTVDANGVVNKGVAALTGLTAKQILFGASDGTVGQDASFYFEEVLGNDFLYFGSNDYITSNVTELQIYADGKSLRLNPTANTITSNLIVEQLTPSELVITDGVSQLVSAPVATYPSLTELTYLKGVTSSIQTQLNAKGTGNVTKVGTPVDNQIGVWTGDGTIEGEASLTYDATAGFDLANSFDAQWATTGAGTLITGNLSNASATGKIIDLQHDEVTKFQVTYTGSTVIGKTSVDAVHALKAGQLGVGATGDVFQMANSGGNTTTFTVDGKIDLYATEVPANGEILIGDGADMELATISAGQDITVTNAAGSITIANTFNLDAGTYTPTMTIITNLDALTATGDFMYQRIGNIVTVWGKATIDVTASGTTTFAVSLPIASNFTVTATDLYGFASGISTATGKQFAPDADTTNDRASFSAAINNTAAIVYPIWFSYIVK